MKKLLLWSLLHCVCLVPPRRSLKVAIGTTIATKANELDELFVPVGLRRSKPYVSAETAMTPTAPATTELATAITEAATATIDVAQGLKVIRFLVPTVGSEVDTTITSLYLS